jgi:KDO2-lipid IV(A) lauroyltransferase
MRRIFHLLQAVAILAVTYPISLLPLSLITKLGELLGTATYHVWKSRRRIAVDNISHALHSGCLSSTETPEHIARESFRHLGTSVMELIKVYHNRGSKILDSVSIRGLENYTEALRHNKGIIFLTGHYGNWELSAIIFSLRFKPMHVVARKINNDYLNNIVEKVRSNFGNAVIYKQGALRSILSALHSGNVVGILFDQSVMENEGIIVDFLCRKAWTMKIPVVISQKTGAPLLPAFIKRSQSGHVVTIHPPFIPDKSVSLEESLLKLNNRLEEHIKEDPHQWLWIHRRWKRTEDTGNNV